MHDEGVEARRLRVPCIIRLVRALESIRLDVAWMLLVARIALVGDVVAYHRTASFACDWIACLAAAWSLWVRRLSLERT